jgi:3-oxoacyl-[acyl-carrier protein] reductase
MTPFYDDCAFLGDWPGVPIAVNGSVTEAGFADRFINSAMERFGGIDIIVNNAGYTWDATIQKMTDEQFQAMLDVHLVAPFRILRAAAEPIRILAKREAEAGREVFRKVVNISSIVGLYGNAGQASYSAAKASLIGLTRTLCKERGRYKVNVNCVAFGLIGTRLTQPIEQHQATIDIDGREIKVGVQPHLLSTLERLIPLGRAGHARGGGQCRLSLLYTGIELHQRAGCCLRRRHSDVVGKLFAEVPFS